jgi:hypothetical protein
MFAQDVPDVGRAVHLWRLSISRNPPEQPPGFMGSVGSFKVLDAFQTITDANGRWWIDRLPFGPYYVSPQSIKERQKNTLFERVLIARAPRARAIVDARVPHVSGKR